MAIRVEKWLGSGSAALPALLGGGYLSFGGRIEVRGTEAQVTAAFGGAMPTDLRTSDVPDAATDRFLTGTVTPATTARTRTTGALPAYTRTGNRIQSNANGALGAQDGVALAVGDVLLLLNGAAGADNGPYRIVQLGDAGTPFIMDRVSEFDSSVEAQPGFAVRVVEGITSPDRTFILTTDAPITINATALTFALDVGTPAAHAATHEIGGSDPVVSLPTAAQKAALPGTNGTPGAANRYVVETDGRVARVEQSAVVQTVDATPTVLWTRTLDDDRVYAFRVTVTARRTDMLGSAVYERVFRARRASGGAALILGNTFIPFPDYEDVAALDVTIDTSANQVRALVTGIAGGTIRWSAEVEFHSVT